MLQEQANCPGVPILPLSSARGREPVKILYKSSNSQLIRADGEYIPEVDSPGENLWLRCPFGYTAMLPRVRLHVYRVQASVDI